MTAFHNEDSLCRKSSVYNQTGQTYFQQMSAYNHMSVHLRRVLLAPCVVDSRNKRYMRDRGPSRSRLSSRSRSLDKIRTQEDIIDGVAYDTKHHPLDVLRMRLECSPKCRQKELRKRVGEVCQGCDDWSGRCPAEFMSSTIDQRMAINSEADGAIRPRLRSHSCKPSSTARLKHGSTKTPRLIGNSRKVGPPLVANRGEWKKNLNDRSRTMKPAPSRSNVEAVEPSYSYASSFESSSRNSSAPGSPVRNKSGSSRGRSPEAADEIARPTSKPSETVERDEEAKYAKFIYDITQEIMINGLYTDDELHAIFKKHIDMNSDKLDRNKMQSEIYQLKTSLNVPERPDDEEELDIDRSVGYGCFSRFTPKKPPTPPKILDEDKLVGKLRNHEDVISLGGNHKPKNSQGKGTGFLVDANPELLITEQDVLLTLMEMKLDPAQIRSICKSLQNKSRETAIPQTVQVDAEASNPRRREDRANSPIINSNTESREFNFYYPESRDWIAQDAAASRKAPNCQCRCADASTNVHCSAQVSQMGLQQPEMLIQSILDDSQVDKVLMACRSKSSVGISDVSTETRSIMKSESKKTYDVFEINNMEDMEEKLSQWSQRFLPQSSRNLLKLGSVKSRENQSEQFEELENMAKMNMRSRSSSIEAEDRIQDNSPVQSRERSEDEQKETSEKSLRRSTSGMQAGNRIEDDSSVKSEQSRSEGREQEIISRIKMKTRGEEDSLFDSNLEKKTELKEGSLEKIDKASKISKENVEIEKIDSPGSPIFKEEPDITLVSHSEFMRNLGRYDENSLPDISERTEVVTEDIETDEILTIGSQTTPHRYQVEEITDNDLGNLSEHTSEISIAPIKESSPMIVSENTDAILKQQSLEMTEADEVQKKMSKESEISAIEEDYDDLFSLSSTQNSEDSEKDSDESEQVVVADLKPLLSPVSLVISSSRINPDVDGEQGIAAEEIIFTPESTPRISSSVENRNDKASEKSNGQTEANDEAEGSKKSVRSDEKYPLKKERRTSNSEDETGDTSSELDRPEKFNSASEMHSDAQNGNEKIRVPSGEMNSKDEDQDKENHESYELGQQSNGIPMTIDEISKNKMGVSRTVTDSSISEKNLQEEIENSTKQREKNSIPQIRSTRFSRLIGKRNPERNDWMQSGPSETSGKNLRDSEINDELREAPFLDGPITTASDISYFRQQRLNDSAQLSTETPLASTDQLEEMEASNSREIEENVTRSSSLLNQHQSTDLKNESASENLKQSGSSISKRMKAAVENLIRRSSKSSQSKDEATQISPINNSSMTTTGSQFNEKYFPLSKNTKSKLPSTLAIKTRKPSCACNARSDGNGNCRPDCKGRQFVCDEKCSTFHQSLRQIINGSH